MKKSILIPIIILLIVVIGIALYYFAGLKNDIECKTLLQEAGWHVEKGGLTSNQPVILSHERINSVSQKENSNKQQEILSSYEGEKIYIYSYELEELGKEQALHSELWLCKGNIINLFIYHSEPNLKLMYWPVNTNHITILEDIDKLLVDK